MQAEAAERAALEKARAEQLDSASLDELLRACVPLYQKQGWTVRPPRKRRQLLTCGSGLRRRRDRRGLVNWFAGPRRLFVDRRLNAAVGLHLFSRHHFNCANSRRYAGVGPVR
jgi:hypothetical protein